MDVYCPICGEPWDFDSLHEEAAAEYGIPYYEDPTGPLYVPPERCRKNPAYDADAYAATFKRVRTGFQTKGCAALPNLRGTAKPCQPEPADAERDRTFGLTRSEASAALYDLLGDDMDGAAAMLDDLAF